MALIDDVEAYGAAVAAGDMTKQEAIAKLVEAGNGGITHTGAATLIESWQTVRGGNTKAYNRQPNQL